MAILASIPSRDVLDVAHLNALIRFWVFKMIPSGIWKACLYSLGRYLIAG